MLRQWYKPYWAVWPAQNIILAPDISAELRCVQGRRLHQTWLIKVFQGDLWDISSPFCGDQTQLFFIGSLTISICDRGFLKQNHDVSQTISAFVPKSDQSIITARDNYKIQLKTQKTCNTKKRSVFNLTVVL